MNKLNIKSLSEKDIIEKIREEKANLSKMRFNHSIAGTENPMLLRIKRKDVARMMTALNEMKNNTK
jgi:large subunit ribosomal protein L29